jgi:hypothetical protein
MSYKSCMMTLQRLRAEHRDNPDPEVQRTLATFMVEIGMQRIRDVLHTSELAWLTLTAARNNRPDDTNRKGPVL